MFGDKSVCVKIKYMDRLFKIFFQIKKRKMHRRIKTKRLNLNYLKYKSQATILVKNKLEHFNQFYNYKYNRVVIRNQKTRWGSCSKRGNLNFNYKVALLSEREVNYIVVHELCHLGEFNHSQRFWDLVARTIPDYKDVRNSLKTNGLRLG